MSWDQKLTQRFSPFSLNQDKCVPQVQGHGCDTLGWTSIYCAQSVSLPAKKLSMTLTSGSLGGLRHIAPEVTSVQVLHTPLEYRCQAPGLIFQTHNRHHSSIEGPCPVTAATAFLPLGFHGFSEPATPKRPVGLLPAQPS